MPRVVPSQVVTMVKTMFPIVLEERYTKIALTRVTIEALSTVVELVESIPEELVTLEGPDYTYIAGHRDVCRVSSVLWRLDLIPASAKRENLPRASCPLQAGCS